MNQKAVLISGLVLVAIIVVLSFAVEVESSPSGDSILFLGRHLGIDIPACLDTDDGMDFYRQGSIATNTISTTYDTCTTDGRFVREYYCRDGKRGIMQYRCDFGCDHGACRTKGQRLGISPAGSGYMQK
jgi:hypothetical protein